MSLSSMISPILSLMAVLYFVLGIVVIVQEFRKEDRKPLYEKRPFMVWLLIFYAVTLQINFNHFQTWYILPGIIFAALIIASYLLPRFRRAR